LQWRDQLFGMGWDGQAFETDSSRLLDLFDVEIEAEHAIALNQAQRVFSLLNTLEYADPGIDSIIVYSSPDSFSPAVLRLLEHLEKAVPLHWQPPVKTNHFEPCDLQSLRDWFRSDGKDSVSFLGDGSLLLQEADSALELASMIQLEAHHLAKELATCWVVDSSHEDDLFEGGACLQAPGLPVHARLSRNPVLHWVLLFFHNLWEPFDPGSMMEYLLHPVGGLPIKVRRKIAEFIASQPGYDFDAWVRCLQDDSIAKNELEFWLVQEKFNAETGIPTSSLQNIGSKLSTLLYRKSALPGSCGAENFHSARAFIEIVLGEMDLQRDAFISKKQFEKTAFQIASRLGLIKVKSHELGSFSYFHSGFSLLEGLDAITWWPGPGFSAPSHSWTQTEIEDFEKQGFSIGELERESRLAWVEMERVLSHSKKQLRILRTREFHEHPIFSAISAAFENPQFSNFLVSSSQQKEIAPKPLPVIKRWWAIEDLKGVLALRDLESYSSLSSLVFTPYKWVFRYACGLKQHLEYPVLTNRLRGQLAHRFYEVHFSDYQNRKAWADEQIQSWFDSFFPDFIQTQGAIFLREENRAQIENFRRVMKNSLLVLHKRLQNLGARSVFSEHRLRTEEEIALEGVLDLLVELEGGQWLVLDVKWSRSSSFVDDIQKGKALQLAVYEHLVSQNLNSSLVYCGFFVITDARMILHGKGLAGIAPAVTTSHHLSKLYLDLLKDVATRLEQLQDGWVEVPVEGTADVAYAFTPGKAVNVALDGKNKVDRFNDYYVLTGWRNEPCVNESNSCVQAPVQAKPIASSKDSSPM